MVQEFISSEKKTIKKLSKKLRKVVISRRAKRPGLQLEEDVVCKMICHRLEDVLNEFVRPFNMKIIKGSPEDRFLEKLHFAKQNNTWGDFYKYIERLLDTIIGWARNKSIVKIYVERNGGKQYRTFAEARVDKNEKKLNKSTVTKKQKNNNNNNSNNILTNELENERRWNSNLNHPSTSRILVKSPNVSEVEEMRWKRNENERKNDKKEMKEYQNELSRLKNKSQSLPRSQVTPNEATIYRTPSVQSVVSLALSDTDFQYKLRIQKERHENEMRNIRTERERLQRKSEDDLERLQEESNQRMRMFWECLRLKHRWEDQEKQWEEYLRSARNPVLKMKNRFLEIETKSYRMVIKDYGGDFYVEVKSLQTCVVNAYNKLIFDFDNFSHLSTQFEGKLFIRVIMKKLSLVATKLCLLIEALKEFDNTETSFNRIKSVETNIYGWEIPTARELRNICQTAHSEDYSFIPPPKYYF